ncbi:MAG TPA: pyroglutamyl-peptidase I [Rhodanobacteraceae bacterium]|nr:pyroglutamyl-peptidase I [Rhodanobacteraceae bacterium]
MKREAPNDVLVTGFSPFAGEMVNPSWQVARALDGAIIAGHRVSALELPTEFAASIAMLRATLRRQQPRVVVAAGLAGGREGISLERVAINVIDARIPDNAGAQPVDVPVVRRAAPAYFSSLPIKAALAALQREDIPAHVSQTAGTYVCNALFYALMHAAKRHRGMRAGFVHVPWLPDQARRHAQPGMPLEQMMRALETVIRTALSVRTDARTSAGPES